MQQGATLQAMQRMQANAMGMVGTDAFVMQGQAAAGGQSSSRGGGEQKGQFWKTRICHR